MTRQLQVGDRGIDAAADIDPAELAKVGGTFMFGYSAGAGNTSSLTQHKLTKPGKIRACKAAGIVFFMNSEWYETRVEEGRRAGLDDGRADLAFWQSRGADEGKYIRVSWDAAPNRKKYRRVKAYLKAYEEGLGGYYHVAHPYAGTPFLRWLSRRPRKFWRNLPAGWRSESPGYNNDGLPWQPDTVDPQARADFVQAALTATPAAFVQTGNTWEVDGQIVDEDVLIRVPADAAPPPEPPPVTPPTPQPPATPGADLLSQVETLAQQIVALAAPASQEPVQ